jgi:acyl-coenzyme A synthetase/AMP-(fatty) acid ligase
MLTHRNATSFVDWCARTLQPTREDRFSSHAPFHFDLSILDLYVPLTHGASVLLLDERTAKDPLATVDVLRRRGLTVWYSTPSVLTMLLQYGRLDAGALASLRLLLFAGEVFPIKHLAALRALAPASTRFLNLYGPTETNVCTWYELDGPVPADRVDPYPIGRPCDHAALRVVDADGREVSGRSEGELLVAGDGVMKGYWGMPEATARAFVLAGGQSWYRTGDIVGRDAAGELTFVGRRDRMVKRRGYRVELGEIEAALARHPWVQEAAAVVESDDEGVRVIAHVAGGATPRPTIIALKTFCAGHLPAYMVPDRFVLHHSLPRTSTDKIDYVGLKAPAGTAAVAEHRS